MVGIFLYIIASRLDIMQEMGLVARFQAWFHEIHVIIVKRIFKYLQGTIDYRVWYAKSREFRLKAYTDAD